MLHRMLPSIQPRPQKLTTINVANVHLVTFIPTETSKCEYLITASKLSVEIWKKRTSSVYNNHCTLETPPRSLCTCVAYVQEKKILFVGLADGWVYWYDFFQKSDTVAEIIGNCRVYHTKFLKIIPPGGMFGYMVSCDSSTNFMCHEFPTTNHWNMKLHYKLDSKCTAFEYDHLFDTAFIGQKSGQITVLRCKENDIELQTLCLTQSMLRAHKSVVSCVKFVARRRWVIGGFNDGRIMVFKLRSTDVINFFQLNAHESKITSILYINSPRMLISAGLDWTILKWDFNPAIQRTKQPKLDTKHRCQICDRPAKWNIVDRAVERRRGYSLHHCLHCGKTICNKCSATSINDPLKGFELPVHTCKFCAVRLEYRISTTAMNYIPIKVSSMDAIEFPHWLVTANNCSVDIWEYGRHLNIVDN